MTRNASSPATSRDPASFEGKYLTFRLGGEDYGLEILKVQEIIGLMRVTPVPQTPHCIRGVINLRGKVIPVVDLRLKFGMDAAADTDHTCVIVVEVEGNRVGIIVDDVCEVLDIAAAAIEPPPAMGRDMDRDFILGMGKVGDRVKILLDIERVLVGDAAGLECATSEAHATGAASAGEDMDAVTLPECATA
jgi:purine-binding chemotaxis protein CheW